MKRAGGSDEEAAVRSLRVAKGVEPPPPGVSLEMAPHDHADHEGHAH